MDVEDEEEDAVNIEKITNINKAVDVMNSVRRVIKENVKSNIRQAQERQKKDYDKRHLTTKVNSIFRPHCETHKTCKNLFFI